MNNILVLIFSKTWLIVIKGLQIDITNMDTGIVPSVTFSIQGIVTDSVDFSTSRDCDQSLGFQDHCPGKPVNYYVMKINNGFINIY